MMTLRTSPVDRRRLGAAGGFIAAGVLAAAAVLVLVSRPFAPAGDFCEYVQMTVSLANHGSPDVRAEDVRPLLERCPRLSAFVRPAPRPAEMEPYFRARNGRYYSFHFWGYPLAAVPWVLAARAVGSEVWAAFPLLNAILLVAALAGIAFLSPLPPLRSAALVALTVASPALWFLPWPHPEVFCYALATVALLLADRVA